MARTKNSGSDVLSIKSAKHKSVSGDTSNASNAKSVKSVKKNAKTAKRSSSSTATSVSGRRLGVAAVALASTLSMVLPGAAALARTSFNPDSFDPSYVNSVAKTSGKGAGNGAGKGSGNGKGDGDGNGLYKHGLLNMGAISDSTTRQMVDSVKEYLVKNDDSNINEEGADNQKTVAGDSSVGVKDSGEYFVTNGDSSSPSNRSFDTNNFEDRSATSSADSNGDSSADNNGVVAGSNNSNEVGADSSRKRIKAKDQTATKSEQDTASSEIAKPVKSAKKSDAKQTKAEQTNPAETGKVAEKPKSNASVPATKTTEKPAVAKPKVENSVKPADTKASDTKPAATNPDAVKPAGTKPAAAPASKQPTQPETSQTASAKPAAKPAEAKQPEAKQPTNAGGVKPAEVKPAENKQPEQPANAQSGNAESAKPAAEQNTNAQPSSTNAENTNTVSAANTPKVRKPRSVKNNGGDNSGSSVPSAENVPASSANNTAATPTTTPASNTTAPSAPVTPASAESNAGAGTTAKPSAEKPSAQGNTQGNAQGATTGVTGEDKSATPSAPTSNTGTQNTGTTNTGSATNNTATDPNSQVIKPNTDNPEAKSTEQANEQVQTDKKPNATYNLKIRYTIGGAANKQLVQPYELTIDVAKLNELDKDGKYEYIELPKAAGYRPSVYHSGDYQYYVKKGEGDNSKFVIDDGTDADAIRYLRLSKKLITDYAVKERPAVGGNNGAQAPQSQTTTPSQTNPQSSSSSQPKADDGIQYYGELNINYAPKTAKYYVRHLVQKLDNKDEFEEAPNIGKAIVVEHKTKDKNNNITITKEVIHVTEITGTVGSDVTAVSTYIPGYEPEHNLISSPLSDSEDESDKLVLNLRYYRKAYEVTYDSAGGTDVTAQKVYYGQKVPEVPEPTYRGHKFLGWQVVKLGDSSSSGPLIKGTSTNYKMPDHNVQFRAAWSANAATSYRVNVWVQKADLVDKEHPDSLANYDFVGLVERKNVQTDSEVALDKMNDAGVVDDASKLNGANETDYVKNPELGLTREELQGKDSEHETGLIAKFNWMNDTHVTNLDGYDTKNPDAAGNKGKDLFTRYFHVNKELTKELNTEKHDFVPGRPDLGKRSKSQLCADDLNNTLNLVYDRNTYELIFAKPAGLKFGKLNNAAIKKKDEHGKTTIYCYAGGGNCSEKYDGKDGDDNGAEINHKGYSVKVRYGQKLTDIWPGVEEIDLSNDISDDGDKAFLGWKIGFAGKTDYRDTPPFRLTKKEFADPSLRVVGDGQAPKISDDPSNPNAQQYELKDNQRLLTADTTGASNDIPYTVIIKKQSIASAKNGDTGNDIKYELSTDTYSKDDTSHTDYAYTAPSIAGFSSVSKPECDTKDRDDFNDDSEALYEASSEYKKDSEEWDKLTDDDEITEAQAKGLLNFRKKYHIKFRDYLGPAPSDSDEDPDAAYGPDAPSDNYEKNAWLEMKYKRQSYAVQFYNADGNAIKDGDVAATEKLPFEYSLTKRGNAKLTGEDKDLYGNDTSYDASVTKDDANDTSKQLDGKYTFTLNNKTYSIVRPDNLPKDYVFKGWAVDQAGTRFINGEDKDITMPVNGIKLYAAWGKPEGIKHTVTLNYNMPEIDGNGKEIKDSNVVTKQQFDHYYVIKENKDIKVPTRKGYDFYGWEIDKNGTKLPYAFGNKVVEDIKLDAVWVKDTRYNGTFKHIFLKPGYTFTDYKKPGLTAAEKAAMVDHVSTQTVSGLREHLRYNAEAVYSDETHFPDKHFTSFEASSDEDQNTGEFIYQTYNTRKYKVRYVTIGKDGKEKNLLPESEVSSVNRKYDVAFYKPIEGFMPETTQDSFTYKTDEYGKQDVNNIPEITFKYKDVRVLKRKNDGQARPDHYTRYVFKVDNKQSSMGSVVDWQGSKVADGSALVYDAIKGTKAYQMPLPTVKAKPGFEFAGWTSKIGSSALGSTELQYSDGVNRLPIRSEEQNSPEVIYIANFKLKAPVAAAPQVLTPKENISTGSSNDAKKLITNATDYPAGATFSFAQNEKFDNTPGLHKIKVQVHLDGNTAEAEVLYRVLPDLVYKSDWEKFKATEYGSKHAGDYAPITFTGKNDEGTIIGHDGGNTNHPAGGTTTLTAYVYKGKDVRIRVPQAFGMDHGKDNYHYVFKGWTTRAETDPAKITEYDIDSESRYKDITVNVDSGKTYHAIYKRIDYFSSSSDGGEVPKDSVVAIFKPAPGRLWDDGSDGPKVFYIKKGKSVQDHLAGQKSILEILQGKLTGVTGWSQSSMIPIDKTNVKDKVEYSKEVTDWIMGGHAFQEFVAKQKKLTKPKGLDHALLAVQGVDKLPSLEKYIENYTSELENDSNISDIKVEYASKAPNINNAATYTVPLKVTITYKDVRDPQPYDVVGVLQVLPKLVPQNDNLLGGSTPGSGQGTTTKPDAAVVQKITNTTDTNSPYAKVTFENAADDHTGTSDVKKGKLTGNEVFYVVKDVSKGVTAPQAVGKDYDDAGYHYVFRGWELIEGEIIDASGKTIKGTAQTSSATVPSEHDATHPSAVRSAFTAMPFTTFLVTDATTPTTINESNVGNVNNAENDKIYTSEEVKKWKFKTNARLQAVYEKVNNVIDAKSNEKVPDNYVPYVFLPGFGRRWTDGTYNPKVLYFDPKSGSYYKSIGGAADTLKEQLKGFGGWSIYDAAGKKSAAPSDKDKEKKTRVYVANQAHINDVNASDIVLSVGDNIPDPEDLVHSNGDKVDLKGMQGAGVNAAGEAITKPGITTVVVNVTRKNDSNKDVTVPVKVHIRVLPQVIADQDLPEKGTKEYEFIAENYTKVTYVASDGGEIKSPVFTYWVRKGAKDLQMPVPDVLADNGYVFKDWSSKTIGTPAAPADQRKATSKEREALAHMAIRDCGQYVANIILNSHNSTLAALQNLLSEAKKLHVRDKDCEKFARLAEAAGKPFIAKIIRKSEKSSLEALKQLLRNVGVNPEISMPEPQPTYETTITANFEKMAPMKFTFSGSAREGILTNFRLQNMTEGSGDANNKITVDGKEVTINELVSQVKNSVNGINANCAGTACTISGTPKIVDSKPKVELTFTTTDKYGRQAEITVEIDVISESKPAPMPVPTPAPVPTPVPPAPAPAPSKPEEEQRQEEYPMPESYPYIPMPEAPSSEVVPEQAAEPKQKTEPEAVKDSAKQPSEALPQTGSDVTQSALIASLLASVGLAGFAAKHRRRKNEDNES
ncbi:InlB B-repeat-containing protein [Gardnerella vaginalis]|uniref:InlB B-repeat-containing protein n=1 Tax=Gardnerella vaginalis TaxID=2702 RepID=UPI0039EEDB07